MTERAPAVPSAGTVLHHLERNLFEPDSERIEPDGSLRLLEAAGSRGEADDRSQEARLLADGAGSRRDRDRGPQPRPPGAADRLPPGRMGIPLAPEASVPLAATATGRACSS